MLMSLQSSLRMNYQIKNDFSTSISCSRNLHVLIYKLLSIIISTDIIQSKRKPLNNIFFKEPQPNWLAEPIYWVIIRWLELLLAIPAPDDDVVTFQDLLMKAETYGLMCFPRYGGIYPLRGYRATEAIYPFRGYRATEEINPLYQFINYLYRLIINNLIPSQTFLKLRLM